MRDRKSLFWTLIILHNFIIICYKPNVQYKQLLYTLKQVNLLKCVVRRQSTYNHNCGIDWRYLLSIRHVTILTYKRGTLGDSEHHNTAEEFAKYSNIAKNRQIPQCYNTVSKLDVILKPPHCTV